MIESLKEINELMSEIQKDHPDLRPEEVIQFFTEALILTEEQVHRPASGDRGPLLEIR